jgi:hypothetical protein
MSWWGPYPERTEEEEQERREAEDRAGERRMEYLREMGLTSNRHTALSPQSAGQEEGK